MAARTIYATEPAKGWRPWGAFVPFLAILLVAIPTAGMSFALEHFRFIDAKENPTSHLGLILYLLLPFTALGLVLFAWVRLVERRSLATIGLQGTHPIRTFVGGLLVGVLAASGIVGAIWLAGGATAGALAPAAGAPSALLYIAILLAGFALQSSVEEIVFRGWMLSAVAFKFGVVPAVVLTSIVFAFLHFNPHEPPLFTVTTLLFSAFACCWSLRTRNIWGVMGWHAAWNWLLAVGFELRVTGLDAHVAALLVKMTPHGSDLLTGGGEGPEGSIMCAAFSWPAAPRSRPFT
jgi:hypothetical protein